MTDEHNTREEMRRRSPAMAFLQDMIEEKGDMPRVETSDLRVPGEIAAAIQTNRHELLVPLRNRISNGEVFPEETAQAIFALLHRFYRENAVEPILSDLMEGLEPVARENLEVGGVPSVKGCLLLLDKLKIVIQSIDHRRREVNDGKVPIDQIADGPSRAISYH